MIDIDQIHKINAELLELRPLRAEVVALRADNAKLTRNNLNLQAAVDGLGERLRERPQMQIQNRGASGLRATVAEQEAMIDVLKGALSAQGMEALPAPMPELKHAPRQVRVLCGILFEAHPKCVSMEDILERLPSTDRVLEREPRQVNVVVHKLRHFIGHDSVENVRGEGYRMSDAFHHHLSQPVASVDEDRGVVRLVSGG